MPSSFGAPENNRSSLVSPSTSFFTPAGDSQRKPCALIVSANQRKAYPICKSLKKMGYNVIGAFYLWRSSVFSRHIDHRFLIPNPYENEQHYLHQIAHLITKFQPLVIPVGFIDALLFSKYKHRLPSEGLILAPDYEALNQAADKAALDAICRQARVKYPKTVSITPTSWRKAFSALGLPLVVKGSSDAARPEYVFHASRLEHIISTRKEQLLAQQFIPGWGTGYFAVAQNGHIIADYVHRRIVETQPSGGPSLVACHSQNPTVYELGRRIVSALNWSGIVMVEFRIEEESGDYYLIEINPKFWGSLELATAWGLDFPRFLIESHNVPYTEHARLPHQLIRGCFSWILPGFSAYFRTNPRVWLRMLWHSLSRLHRTDIHLRDPAELLYGIITRLGNVARSQALKPVRQLQESYKHNQQLLVALLAKNKLRAIVFDLDGTLVTLAVNWEQIRKRLIHEGLLKPHETSVMIGLYQAQLADSQRYVRMSQLVEAFEKAAIERIRPSKMLASKLKLLRQNDIHLGVVSKQTENNIHKAIQHLGLTDSISSIIGREQGMKRTHQVALTLQALHVKAEETALIGDTLVDAASAAELHMTPVAIANNPYRFQQFVELGVPVFHDISEFLQISTKIFLKKKE